MKEWTNKYNPFNSDKYMAQVPKWRGIKRGSIIPTPTTISVDPTNKCNLECIWCNADYIIGQKHKDISEETLIEIADALPRWPRAPENDMGVEALCLSGGGENLLPLYSGDFLNQCSNNGIKVGIVSNGTLIHRHLESLANNCTWVGISVDAGTSETFNKLKGKNFFDKVISNMSDLIEYSKKNNTILNSPGLGPGVCYKYLLHPGNVSDVFTAAKIAKDIGCKSLHIRPYGTPWDKTEEHVFNKEHLNEFREQIMQARNLETDTFRVYGITHKFTGDFRPNNTFKECYGTFMSGVIMPPSGEGKFDFGFCFDRRGDEDVTIKNLNSMEELFDFWSSEKHWEMFEKIKPKSCPRCTLKPHNEIFENMVLENNTTYEFI
jgi:sulfatase maturation enzyme AslB (radical SAM superfamily)